MRSIQVYQPDDITGTLEMKFINAVPSEISGIQPLLQNIALFIKTRPGSDSFDPERGTVLGDLAMMTKLLNTPEQLRILATDAVDKTQTYIIQKQETQRQLGQIIPPEATLVRLEINNIYQGEDLTSVFIEILVYTEGSQQYFITV